MKKVLLYFSAIICSLIFLSSCDTDNDGKKYGGDMNGASFLSTRMAVKLAQDVTEYSIQVNRTNASEEVSIPITFTDASQLDIFTVPSSVIFSKDENIAYIKVGINPENAIAGKEYTLKITLDKEYLSPGANQTISFVYSKLAAAK